VLLARRRQQGGWAMSDPSVSNPLAEKPPPENLRRRGLDLTFGAKLLLSMCGVVLLTGVVIIYVADRNSRASTQLLATELFREVSNDAVDQTRGFVLRAGPVAESLEELSRHGLAMDDLDKLAPQLVAFLRGNAGMTWVLYGDESGDYTGATRMNDGKLEVERTHIADGKTHRTVYDIQSDGSWKVARQDDDSGYDPRKRPFYVLAKERGKLSWTRPYMFFTQGVPGISCVMPVNRATGEFRGVFSVEFDLNALSEFVSSLSVSAHSRVFMFTPDQILLAHPNERNLQGKGVGGKGALLTLADTGDPLVDVFRENLPGDYLHMARSDEFRFFRFDHDGVRYMASTTIFPIGDGQDWVVGAIAPESDFLSAVWRTRWLTLCAAAGALIVAAALAGILAQRISTPVQSLIAFMNRVGGGDLEARADFQGGREFRQLSVALNRMITELRERLQLRHSLDLAMEVQKSLLPEKDPTPSRLDIAGRSTYCDQTGGDYYDFIDVSPLSKSKLLVAVGDVMGHGIAAALLMASARAALHSGAMRDPELGALLTHTNAVLAKDTRHNRFMTLSLLQIDGETGDLCWASAGHDPAIIFDPHASEFRELEGGDLPLGMTEGIQFEEFRGSPLTTGCVMAIGTDGVWEMQNEKEEQYGKDRLREVLKANYMLTSKEIAAALEADLAKFRGAQTTLDDVTFVIVKFN
jgi:sigma-B regulation protein RsbU (phosphoserine phosphatase)